MFVKGQIENVTCILQIQSVILQIESVILQKLMEAVGLQIWR